MRLAPSWGWVLLAFVSLMASGCASAPGPDAPGVALVAGEWRGDAKVGPKVGCCKGGSGAVRLVLEQNGSVVKGVVEGPGWRGTVRASVKGAEVWGSCNCTTSNLETSLPFEASVSREEMVMRMGDATMTLTRTP